MHCHKNDYHTDRNSGLLSEFYKELKEYILNEIFKDGDLLSEEFGESFTNDEVRQSLNSDYIVNKKYLDDKNYSDIRVKALLALSSIQIIFSNIHFPKRDSRDIFDYLKILNLFGKCLKLEEHLFDEDALIIENHQAQRIGLADADGKVYLEVEFDAPLFGIWSPAKKHAPFVCIEPWYGRSDREDFDHILENREWGNELEPGDIFEKDYKILVK